MNHLSHEKSPYLLQHALNPVDWYPWGTEAFERAKREDKPVFLSIGYSTCHWCHVMAHESFEDEEVAKILNQNYIAIKVDREERPEIDAVYMSVCQAVTGSGGWPLTACLTPDQEPFFVGTYYPSADCIVMETKSAGASSRGKPSGKSSLSGRIPKWHASGNYEQKRRLGESYNISQCKRTSTVQKGSRVIRAEF